MKIHTKCRENAEIDIGCFAATKSAKSQWAFPADAFLCTIENKPKHISLKQSIYTYSSALGDNKYDNVDIYYSFYMTLLPTKKEYRMDISQPINEGNDPSWKCKDIWQ